MSYYRLRWLWASGFIIFILLLGYHIYLRDDLRAKETLLKKWQTLLSVSHPHAKPRLPSATRIYSQAHIEHQIQKWIAHYDLSLHAFHLTKTINNQLWMAMSLSGTFGHIAGFLAALSTIDGTMLLHDFVLSNKNQQCNLQLKLLCLPYQFQRVDSEVKALFKNFLCRKQTIYFEPILLPFTHYSLTELVLVGIVLMENRQRAWFKLPDQQIISLGLNTVFGRERAVLVRIEPREVVWQVNHKYFSHHL